MVCIIGSDHSIASTLDSEIGRIGGDHGDGWIWEVQAHAQHDAEEFGRELPHWDAVGERKVSIVLERSEIPGSEGYWSGVAPDNGAVVTSGSVKELGVAMNVNTVLYPVLRARGRSRGGGVIAAIVRDQMDSVGGQKICRHFITRIHSTCSK